MATPRKKSKKASVPRIRKAPSKATSRKKAAKAPINKLVPLVPEAEPANRANAAAKSRPNTPLWSAQRGQPGFGSRRVWLIVGVTLVTVAALSLLAAYYWSGVESYDEFRYARASNEAGAFVRTTPGVDGDRIHVLKPKSIFKVLGETRWSETIEGVGSGPWYQVELMSGDPGWVFSGQFEFIYRDVAEQQVHSQQSIFEDRIRKMITDAAAERVYSSGQFPNFRITAIRIVSELKPVAGSASPSFDVYVNAWLIGTWFGIDQKEVSTKVNLDVILDHGMLQASVVRVRHVDILDYVMKEGLSVDQAANLLMHVL